MPEACRHQWKCTFCSSPLQQPATGAWLWVLETLGPAGWCGHLPSPCRDRSDGFGCVPVWGGTEGRC